MSENFLRELREHARACPWWCYCVPFIDGCQFPPARGHAHGLYISTSPRLTHGAIWTVVQRIFNSERPISIGNHDSQAVPAARQEQHVPCFTQLFNCHSGQLQVEHVLEEVKES